MNQPQHAYISLGSNKNDKFKHLQDAIDGIHRTVGNIKLISKVYRSPAFGFEGEDFLNACLILETELKPKKLMQELLAIEKTLGRVRTKKQGYEARTIDLDIIFFEDEVMDTKTLQLPHPEMHKRKFVLQPLHDIAPTLKHPKFDKDVSVLLAECEDQSVLEPINIWLKNPSKIHNFSHYNYIAIEGNIGAGKTSLANKIAHDFNAKLILERFNDNPFLPQFYENQQRYAFPLEMSFLADRYQLLLEDITQFDLFKDVVIADYDAYKSLIFAKVTLQEEEFNLYKKLFHLMHKELPKPDVYIYLYQNTDRLLENIKKRGREYEQSIEASYLQKINEGYLEFIKSQHSETIKIIDISEMDFGENRKDYLSILRRIME